MYPVKPRRWFVAGYVVVLLALTALFAVNLAGQIAADEFEADCKAQSGQVQPDGKCVRVLKNVSTGVYHIRPATAP